VIDAICMRLSAGVEALARLDTPTRDRPFGDAWPLIIVRRTLEHDVTRAVDYL
jgi:hypothetical protein